MLALKNFNKYWAKLLNSVYPWHCVTCGAQAQNKSICTECAPYLSWCRYDTKCDVCGLPISADASHTRICGICQKHPPYYDCISAVFWYEPPISDFITQFKYFNHWENAQTLIELSESELVTENENSLIIPVPSHASRIKQRGFNAVYELVKLYKKQRNFLYDDTLVSRVKNTETQTGKTKQQRKKNLRNAFKINHTIKHEHIIIIDEVVTTGATVNELSRCLKKAGVKKVTVWAIARTRNKY